MADLIINGVARTDITLVDYSVGPSKVNYAIQWYKKAANPLIAQQQAQEKEIKVTCLVEDTTKDLALQKVSNLLKNFVNCSLGFTDIGQSFNVYMTNEPTITWYGDTDTGYDACRYIIEATLTAGRGYGSVITIGQDITFTDTSQVATINFTTIGNEFTPLIVRFKILNGATTDHLIYLAFNKDPVFEILNEYVTDQFALMDVGNGDLIEVNAETYKILANTVPDLSRFRGDFPIIAAPKVMQLNITFSAIFADEVAINTHVDILYKPRWF